MPETTGSETADVLANILKPRADAMPPSLLSFAFDTAVGEAVSFIAALDKEHDELAEAWGNGEPRPDDWMERWVDVGECAKHVGMFLLWWSHTIPTEEEDEPTTTTCPSCGRGYATAIEHACEVKA